MRDNVVDLQAHQGRQPPASEAAEQALLGAMMYRGEAIDAVAGFLSAEHFHFAGHGRIYEAAVALHRQGREVNAVTLSAALHGDDDVAKEYLADLQASTFIARNAGDYGQIVLDMALRRSLIGTAQEIIADAYAANIDQTGADQADAAVRRMTEVAEAGIAPLSGPRPVSEAIEPLMERLAAVSAAKGAVVGASTGLRDLDHLLGGLQAPTLLVLAARPGMGKTALALNVARHVAATAGPVVFYSLEMSRVQLMQRLIAGPTGIAVDRQRAGPIRASEFVPLQEAAQELGRLPLLLDEGRQRTIEAMRAHARRAKRRDGLALIVVDYLQLMVNGDPRYRVQEVSQLSRNLKMMALDVEVPILALSQLSREVERRQDRRPQLSDLRESGSIEQDADQVAFIYREEMYLRGDDIEIVEKRRTCQGMAEIIIDKNRLGRTGTVKCRFDGLRQRFSDMEQQEAFV